MDPCASTDRTELGVASVAVWQWDEKGLDLEVSGGETDRIRTVGWFEASGT